MSSLSLELTDFINPELTWKKEAKGNRNTSRRARKVIDVSLLLGVEFSNRNSKPAEDASVSDSEKFGVAVLGRRFGDKVEHIPIKKRKLFRSSASPTGVSSPRAPNACTDKKSSSLSQKSVTKSVAKRRTHALKFGRGVSEGKVMDVSRNKIFENEDFSGIDFLATVACGDSMDDDFCRADMDLVVEALSAKEGIGSSGSTGTSTGTAHVLSEAPDCEDYMEGSLSDDNSVALLHSSSSPIKDEGTDKSRESRDGRFHWDLNVVMDAWDHPCDDKPINSQTKVSEDFSFNDMPNRKPVASQGCMMQKDIKENKSDAESTAQSTVGRQTSGDALPDSVSAVCKSSEKQSSIPALTNCAPNSQCVLGFSSLNGSDANASTQSPGMGVCIHKPIPDHTTSLLVPDKNISQGTDGLTGEVEKDDCLNVVELYEASCAKSSLFQQSGLDHFHTPATEEISSKIAGNIESEGGELSEKMSGLYDVGESWVSPGEKSSGTCQLSVKNSVSSTSPLFKEASESNISVEEDKNPMALSSTDKQIVGEDIVKVARSGRLINMSLSLCNAVCDENYEYKFQEQCRNYATKDVSQSAKVVLQDPSRHNKQDSVGPQDNQVPIVCMVDGTRSQEDYDSQYEDGELRESDICEENDIKDGKAEGADIYDGARYYTEAAEYPASFSGRDEEEVEGDHLLSSKKHLNEPVAGFSAHSCEGPGRNTSVERGKCTSSETKRSGVDLLQTSCRRSPGLTEKVIEGKANVRGSKREFLPRAEMAGLIDRKGSMLSQRSRSQNFDDSYQSESSVGFNKSMGRDKSDLHHLDRSQAGNHWVEHSADYWDSKPHNSFNYYGCYDSPAPRNVMENSKGIYRRVIRRSPDDRDDAFMMRSSYPRGRSGRYSQGAGRGYRGSRNGYHGSMPDYPSESFRIPQHISKRDRSFSPVPGRVAPHISHLRRSRSRSRTRSPPQWLLQQEQTTGLRDHSRSPDFRAEVRMERGRIPFRKSNFTPNYERRFQSPPRNRFSPQQSSRWVDKKNSGTDYFGDRRSPVRVFRQNQKFNVTNAPGKVKSDDYFRPVLRSGRFSEVAPSDRARRYEGNDDDRRKYGDRYDAIRPMHQYEKDVLPRHFGHDTEDCLVGRSTLDNEGFARVADGRFRDVPRKSREDKGLARYDSDKMMDSCPKSIDMRSMRRMHL